MKRYDASRAKRLVGFCATDCRTHSVNKDFAQRGLDEAAERPIRMDTITNGGGVLVGNPPEHAHILWIKPYVRYDDLNAIWSDITNGAARGITSKTVKGDKSKRNEMRRLVKYIVEQQNHHGLPVTILPSPLGLKSKNPSDPEGQMILGAQDG